jgi:NADH:ubiquinone oxidoreductase subunit E
VALEFPRLMKLAAEVESAACDGVVSTAAIDELALDSGMERAHLYAAAVLSDDVQIERAHPVQLLVCVGGCQQWGALDRVEQLLRARDERKLALDVVPRACLDRCEHAPAVEVHTPDGVAVIAGASQDAIAEALADLFPDGLAR